MSVFENGGLPIEEKEDHPQRLADLSGILSKYYYTAEEINILKSAIVENFRDKLASGNFQGTAEDLKELITSTTTGVFGPITPATAATFTTDGFATAAEAGDYVFAPGTADEVTITVTSADLTNAVVKINKKGTAYTKEVIGFGFEIPSAVGVVEQFNENAVQSGAVSIALKKKVDYLVNKPVSQYYNDSFFVDQEYNNSGNLVPFAGLSTTEMAQVEVPAEGLTVALVGITGGGGTQLEVYDENLTLISNISFASFTKILEEINTYKYTLTNTNIKFFTLRASSENIPNSSVFGILEFPIIKIPIQKVNSDSLINFSDDKKEGFTTGKDLLDKAKTNLAIPLPDGNDYLGTPTGSLRIGQTNTALEKIPTAALKQYAFTVDVFPTNPTAGQYFNSAGAQVGLILREDFFTVPNGQGFIIPDDPAIASFSLFFKQSDTDLSTVRVYEADNALEPIFKSSLLPEVPETTDGIATYFYNRGNVPKPNVSTLAPAYGFIGQSNQSGFIDLSELPAFWTSNGNQIPDVVFQNSNTLNWHTYNETDYGQPSGGGTFYWSYEMLLLKFIIDNRKTANAANKIYGVKYAVPGTSLNPLAGNKAWTAEFEKIAAGKEALLSTYENRLRIAKESANGALYNMKAIFMHQGESDTNAPQTYYKNIKYLIYYLRGVIGNPKLAFVLGGINTSSVDYRKQIEDAKQQVASEDSFVFYAPVSNGLSFLKADQLHFNALGAQDLTDSIVTIMNANKALFGLV